MSAICHVCKGQNTKLYTSKNGYALFVCTRCGLMFVHPLPPSTEVLYAAEYFSGGEHGYGYIDYDQDKEPMIPAFKKYLEFIRVVLGRRGTMLDVGAATGFFVRLAREDGWEATGIEISDHAASMGRKKGLDIKTGTLADALGVYDCVTMLDVIEHTGSPRAELQKANSLLRKGGVVVINTPDAGATYARIMGKRWPLIIPPEHLYHFNRKNLRMLLEECGFEVVLETTVGKWFTLKYIFKMIQKWTKLGIFGTLTAIFSKPTLSRLSIPLNLYDNMFVIAKKK